MDGEIVRAEDWPHGLRCGECSRPLADGDRYSERLIAMAGEVPIVRIVCTSCAVKPTDQET
jgi:RNase P subunit RPR2